MADFTPDYSDYVRYHQGNDQSAFSESGGSNEAPLLSEADWNALTVAQRWGTIGNHLSLDSGDPRYQQWLPQLLPNGANDNNPSVTFEYGNNFNIPNSAFIDPSRVITQGNLHILSTGNLTPDYKTQQARARGFSLLPFLPIAMAAGFAAYEGFAGGGGLSATDGSAFTGTTGDLAGSTVPETAGAVPDTGFAGGGYPDTYGLPGGPDDPGGFGAPGYPDTYGLPGNGDIPPPDGGTPPPDGGAPPPAGSGGGGGAPGTQPPAPVSTAGPGIPGTAPGTAGTPSWDNFMNWITQHPFQALQTGAGLLGTANTLFGRGPGSLAGYRNAANNAANRADPFGPYRAAFGQYLSQHWQDLVNPDPAAILSSPTAQREMSLAASAATQNFAAQGLLRSGARIRGVSQAVEDTAHGFVQDYFSRGLNEADFLGNMAGANINPAAAAQLGLQGFTGQSGGLNTTLGNLFATGGPLQTIWNAFFGSPGSGNSGGNSGGTPPPGSGTPPPPAGSNAYTQPIT